MGININIRGESDSRLWLEVKNPSDPHFANHLSRAFSSADLHIHSYLGWTDDDSTRRHTAVNFVVFLAHQRMDRWMDTTSSSIVIFTWAADNFPKFISSLFCAQKRTVSDGQKTVMVVVVVSRPISWANLNRGRIDHCDVLLFTWNYLFHKKFLHLLLFTAAGHVVLLLVRVHGKKCSYLQT